MKLKHCTTNCWECKSFITENEYGKEFTDYHRFTRGDCAALAQAINHLDPSWEMASFSADDHDKRLHAFCVKGEWALDIQGFTSREGMCDEWIGEHHREIAIVEDYSMWNPSPGHETFYGSIDRANEIAPLILSGEYFDSSNS